MNEKKFEKHTRNMLRKGYSLGDLIDYVRKDILRSNISIWGNPRKIV
ncbi:MAG: hypothetical protein M3275_00690 [Thermoproteota archaeon]|nr:hypothetical protein [Thermoproteota archaeon]MDQ3966894.1 hypothetical protein [Thermoproteota archaeon]